MDVNWHIYFILKCHLNFGLHNSIEILIFCIIKWQSWFVTKNYQSSVNILCSRMFIQMLKMVAQSIVFTSRPKRETHIRASRVFKFNLLQKWHLIAFCLENLLTNSYTWWNEYNFYQNWIKLGQFVCHSNLLPHMCQALKYCYVFTIMSKYFCKFHVTYTCHLQCLPYVMSLSSSVYWNFNNILSSHNSLFVIQSLSLLG